MIFVFIQFLLVIINLFMYATFNSVFSLFVAGMCFGFMVNIIFDYFEKY